MILLFGEKAHKSHKNSNIKNHPVENSGILARSNQPKSLLAANEYDFELNYTGDIVVNEQKEATVILKGINYIIW